MRDRSRSHNVRTQISATESDLREPKRGSGWVGGCNVTTVANYMEFLIVSMHVAIPRLYTMHAQVEGGVGD